MLSLIFPVYNEEQNIQTLYERICLECEKLNELGLEFIFVDDCSTDKTPELLSHIVEFDKRVRVVRFARNCGSHAAISAGLEIAQGDCAMTMAADLQDPPFLISFMVKEWERGGKIVWGVRQERKGESAMTKFCSRAYYKLMNWLTIVRMPPSGADVFLIDRTVINEYLKMSGRNTSIFMTLAWIGFEQRIVEYVKEARFKGQSKWTLGKKIKLTLDSLLAFSDLPIRYMSLLGFLTAFLGFGYAFYVFWCYVNGSPVEGWSSLIVAILVVGGIQMIMLGILGEYLWRTYDESRKRPRYIIEYQLGVNDPVLGLPTEVATEVKENVKAGESS